MYKEVVQHGNHQLLILLEFIKESRVNQQMTIGLQIYMYM